MDVHTAAKIRTEVQKREKTLKEWEELNKLEHYLQACLHPQGRPRTRWKGITWESHTGMGTIEEKHTQWRPCGEPRLLDRIAKKVEEAINEEIEEIRQQIEALQLEE